MSEGFKIQKLAVIVIQIKDNNTKGITVFRNSYKIG
jgi:hypothetical protein